MRSARSTRASARRSRRGGCASPSSTRRSAPGRRGSRRSPRPRRRSSRRATFCPRSRRAFAAAPRGSAARTRILSVSARSVARWRDGGDRRVPPRRGAGDRHRRARDDAAVDPARICGDPAEGRRFAGLRGDGQSRQAGTDGSSGRGARAAGQGVRTLDHRREARRAALARRDRRGARARRALRLTIPRWSRTRPMP